MSSSSHTANHSPVGAQHHVQSVGLYTIIFVLLLILMALTVGVSYVHLGTIVNNLVAMLIAVMKAALVVSIFMGVAHATKLTKFWAITGLSMITLFTFIGIDYWSRGSEVVHGFYNDEGSALHTGHIPNDPSTMKPAPKVPEPSE